MTYRLFSDSSTGGVLPGGVGDWPREGGGDLAADVARRAVRVESRGAVLDAVLSMPAGARAVVVVAADGGLGCTPGAPYEHAGALHAGGLATLCVRRVASVRPSSVGRSAPRTSREAGAAGDDGADPDTALSSVSPAVAWLASELTGAVWWLAGEEATHALPAGLVGMRGDPARSGRPEEDGAASDGSIGEPAYGAAVLVAAARVADRVAAAVAYGGRPDLANEYLLDVLCPTLFLVDDGDGPARDAADRAAAHMVAPAELEVLSGSPAGAASDAGAARVAVRARDWVLAYRAEVPRAGLSTADVRPGAPHAERAVA